jgi:fructose 1,6-bisphosphate aldolase/phosphatase
MKITVSVIKADVGGFPGHSSMHPALMEIAKKELKGQQGKLLIDYYVIHCGDDLELIMTHRKGVDNKEIHKMAWNIFVKCTAEAKKLKLYGAGQDMLSDTFSGNVKGMGPGVAEMEFEERPSEPIIIFMADKTEPGAWNMALYKIFADPFNTAGLVIDPNMHDGFTFEVHDLFDHKKVLLKCPDEIYDLLALIGQPSRYVIKHVFRNSDKQIAASTSTQRLSLIAGRYVGKDDPVMIIRAQSGLPAVGEILEPFAFPYTVAGWMRGSHHGPFMPVSFKMAHPMRFDGPPRVIAAGFQLAEGRLEGPSDMFNDVSFDLARQKTNEIADYLRRHGPFEPGILSAAEMEYTTKPQVIKKLEKRFKPIKA